MALANVALDDKYALESGRIFLTGTQALVRLPMMQRRRDEAADLNTACLVTGYRGSPLGGVDLAMWRARQFLAKHQIHFQPGVNEDLAATMVWGSQQVNLFSDGRHDGVYAMWYAKGPGVDRSGDVLKHGNSAGTAPHGGVLLLAGDDHACKSSTLAHQSELAFMDASIPVLNPAGVQEILDLGLYGWAMSRYSGCWIGFKTIAETVESSASVYVDPHRVDIVTPDDFEMPPGGLNIRWPDPPLDQELRLHQHKLYAAIAFARANRLDRTVIDSPNPRLGIVTTGKAYLDVRQALDDLGIDEQHAAEIGLRVYKVALTWPLEREGARLFAEGLEEILVVEEKRALIENQLKEQLYNWREDVRPRVYGKFDHEGNWILPSAGELTPARIARAIADRIGRFYTSERVRERLEVLEAKERALEKMRTDIQRLPYYCSGCPHNTSTRVPDGSRALAGIGCHYMVQWMDRETSTFTQMGGEGATWLGQAPFTDTDHVFQNRGDGTYYHSGSLAIRAAVASGVNITYKILYNDAVAMTGGQPVEGPFGVAEISRQLYAEGVRRIVVMSDEPEKYPVNADFAAGVAVHHRDELDRIQRDLRQWRGVSALIYDQTCAAEKRRRRKRGLMPDPPKRAFINDRVCEGCGDCGVTSNCVSVVPLETEWGRKRAIDQSSCNKDFSCVDGFCPSFVTVHGGAVRKPKPAAEDSERFAGLPVPEVPDVSETPYGILVTGIGGTGVVTIGALIGMAAHLEGKGCTVLDMAGLAQKGGAVVSHVRVADRPEDIHAVRIAAGSARLVLGCDMMVAASFDALAKMRPDFTRAVVNDHAAMTGDFTRQPDMTFPAGSMAADIGRAVGDGAVDFVNATRLATALLGDAIGANLFVLGYAVQKGLVPVTLEAIERAVELNGVAVDMNKRALAWGRLAAHDPAAVEAAAAPRQAKSRSREISGSLDEVIERRLRQLTAYQDADYARRYRDLIVRVQKAETQRVKGRSDLTEAVARYYFKLLAYKDEYEVARLFVDGDFAAQLRTQFTGDYTLRFHLAPPLLAERDPDTGHLRKRAFGPWILPAFRLLAKLKRLRGTALDPFGYTEERREERRLIADYEQTVEELIAGLTVETHGLAVSIASVPEQIRGYGHIKQASIEAAKAREADLLAAFRDPTPAATAAE